MGPPFLFGRQSSTGWSPSSPGCECGSQRLRAVPASSSVTGRIRLPCISARTTAHPPSRASIGHAKDRQKPGWIAGNPDRAGGLKAAAIRHSAIDQRKIVGDAALVRRRVPARWPPHRQPPDRLKGRSVPADRRELCARSCWSLASRMRGRADFSAASVRGDAHAVQYRDVFLRRRSCVAVGKACGTGALKGLFEGNGGEPTTKGQWRDQVAAERAGDHRRACILSSRPVLRPPARFHPGHGAHRRASGRLRLHRSDAFARTHATRDRDPGRARGCSGQGGPKSRAAGDFRAITQG